jgi:hypothetical protein
VSDAVSAGILSHRSFTVAGDAVGPAGHIAVQSGPFSSLRLYRVLQLASSAARHFDEPTGVPPDGQGTTAPLTAPQFLERLTCIGPRQLRI